MKHPIRILIAVLAIGLVGVLVYSRFHDNRYVRVENALESRPDDALDVVFVGNSHTYVNSVPRMVQLLVPEGQRPLWFHSSTSSGKILQWHAREGEAIEVLSSDEWDVVVMQPGSTEPLGMPGSMQTHARKMAAAAGSARAIIYMPWARHPGYDPDVYQAEWYAPNYELAVEGMLHNVRAIGLEVAPVGVAWQLAMEETDVELYYPDGNHATRAGSFLAALVLYATIYDADPRETTWTPPGIGDTHAELLRKVAAASSVR
jgi:hypothetical protein